MESWSCGVPQEPARGLEKPPTGKARREPVPSGEVPPGLHPGPAARCRNRRRDDKNAYILLVYYKKLK